MIKTVVIAIVLLSIACNNATSVNSLNNQIESSENDSIGNENTDSVLLKNTDKDSLYKAILSQDTLKEKHILIEKETCRLYLIEKDSILMDCPVCVGIGVGQKKRKGDHKTPEGVFKIRAIQKSSSWTHDFHDGNGVIKGSYGPWFFRLNTPQSPHIGIHGTCFPESMGKRESEGCIRMLNEDLEKLKEQVFTGMTVIINPDILTKE